MFASRARILLAFIQCYLKLCIIWAGPQDKSQGSNPNSNFIVDFLYRHKVLSLFTKIVEGFFFFFSHFKINILNPSRYEGGTSGKESTSQCRRHKKLEFDPWVGKIPWRRAWQPTPVFLLGESHGQRSLQATVHGVTKSQTQLKQLSSHAHIYQGESVSRL